MANILVTGSTGFVGLALTRNMLRKNMQVKVLVRSKESSKVLPDDINVVTLNSIEPDTNWKDILVDVNIVVHLAARVHIMKDTALYPLAEFRRVNVDGTLNLATMAAHCGVKRFIFISSIKVNGEETVPGHPYTESQRPAPEDPYGISKREAEDRLQQFAKETGMEVVIVRAPLVYGPGVKGNFRSLISWLNKGIPLPLGSIHNKRSFVAIDNLVDLIIACIEHPAAANQTFLAGDGEDLSTTELLQRVASALGKPARLIPVPMGILQWTAALLGKKAMMQRLCGSLQVDISKAKNVLGWAPPVSVNEGLRRTVADIRQ